MRKEKSHNNQKDNILIIIASLKKGGGAENVANYQSNLHDHFNIYYLTFYHDDNSYMPNDNIICLNESVSRNIFSLIWNVFSRSYEINNICRDKNISVAIAHLPESSAPLILSTILFRNKAKSIVCIHNALERVLNKPFRILLSILYLRASKIVGVSKNLLNDLFFQESLKKKYVVIHNAIDLKAIPQIKNENEPRTQKNINILTIGRLVEQKNHLMLIEALSKIQLHYHLTIAGDGPMEELLSKFILKKNQKDNISLYGYSSNVFKLLTKADLFVLTSKYEGFGIVLLEAMACGVPIISTDCNYGPREILAPTDTEKHDCFEVGKYGILTPVNDPHSLQVAITYLSNNKTLLKRLRNNGLSRIKDFAISTILEKWKIEIMNIR